jgi:quercetin dioxygenase-like cupin family protein
MAPNAYAASKTAPTATFFGTENRVLLGAGQTEGAAGVVDISVKPGAAAPLHTNTREALMWYGIEGTITLQTEEGAVELAPGDAIFLPKGSTHTFANASGVSARALLVCLPGGFEGFFLDLSGKLPLDMPIGPPPAEIAEIHAEMSERYGVIHDPQDALAG